MLKDVSTDEHVTEYEKESAETVDETSPITMHDAISLHPDTSGQCLSLLLGTKLI